jgi:hypothetical protein
MTPSRTSGQIFREAYKVAIRDAGGWIEMTSDEADEAAAQAVLADAHKDWKEALANERQACTGALYDLGQARKRIAELEAEKKALPDRLGYAGVPEEE